MSQPYDTPIRQKTGKRCQFSMPGRRYNCRCVGAYELNGRFYCAPHYDLSWKVQNPVIGQQHEWHVRMNGVTGKPYDYPTCKRCGVVQVYDGLPQEPCRGHLPRIGLRHLDSK